MSLLNSSAMEINFRLEGGPFDGHVEPVEEIPKAPKQLYVWMCDDCEEIHYDSIEAPPESSRYRYVRTDERGWLYRYGDTLTDGDGGSASVAVPAERELVTA